jgi:hypothetical protein
MPRKIQMPKGKIGPQLTNKILPWVEVYWHTHKRYPSDTDLSAQFGFDAADLQKLHSSKFYLLCLKDRGISHQPKYFTPEQVAAISLITNVYDTRPNHAKLAAIGVTPEQYNGWMQNPEFKNELQRRAEDILDNIFPEAQAALSKKVMSGDVNALKFYYEITGRAASPDAINLKLTMMKIIEAIQKHVKDPVILSAIASEIQGVAPVAEVTSGPIQTTPSPLKAQYMKHQEALHNDR